MLNAPLGTSFKLVVVGAVIAFTGVQAASARDLKITIPMGGKLSPVQRLNREGVEAVKKHQYEKAESLFYKAYLYDPADPFTLNNLGYISELQGQLDRAHKFYEQASKQGCSANIDMSNVKLLEGQPMTTAFSNLQNIPMQVNRMNVNAMQLLSQSRGFEAVALLKQALSLDPQNPFTLNNLGVANEAIGDYQAALKDYNTVASQHSSEPVVISVDRAWRGKPVSDMAAASAQRLTRRLQSSAASESEAAELNLHGVFSANQNDWQAAKQDFLNAYTLDPNSAFSLNNRGYVAEMDGDLETAQFFYQKARRSSDANARVGMATKLSASGKSLFTVAADSTHKVDGELDIYSEERRRQTAPIELTPRGSAATDSTMPSEQNSSPNVPPSTQPNSGPQHPQ